MPLTALFIGTAVATGLFGAGKTAFAVNDNLKANEINTSANKAVDDAKNKLNLERTNVQTSLEALGEEKISLLSGNVTTFVNTFEKIKNIDFTSSVGLEELKKLRIDKNDFEELKELGNFAVQIAGSATAGVTGGALTAFGAYGAATSLAAASTGTAISSLSGAAATNATLAFFGGGSLATGGMGMAGGIMVLGGLVVGPALLVMGLISGAQSKEKLSKAMANQAQAAEVKEALDSASDKCIAIKRRTYMFYNLLAHLDTMFLPLVWQMEDIVQNEGDDYRAYKEDSKKIIMSAASMAGTIKAVLDTPILKEDGMLTDESKMIAEEIGQIIYK